MENIVNGTVKLCGCKGIRSCLLCEALSAQSLDKNIELKKYIYCDGCATAWQADGSISEKCLHDNRVPSLSFEGVTIVHNFVTEEEEANLVREIDKSPWVNSQSGRRKQDFGPKVNFKKKKLNLEQFSGLPAYSKYLVKRMTELPGLTNFTVVEMCNLEYQPERGASIDAHFDDFWLWGERLVTLNLESDSAYTMVCDDMPNVHVVIHLPRRSLVVLSGPARHTWKHAVQRTHINERRIGITFRELSAEFLPGGLQASLGNDIVTVASLFHGRSVAEWSAAVDVSNDQLD